MKSQSNRLEHNNEKEFLFGQKWKSLNILGDSYSRCNLGEKICVGQYAFDRNKEGVGAGYLYMMSDKFLTSAYSNLTTAPPTPRGRARAPPFSQTCLVTDDWREDGMQATVPANLHQDQWFLRQATTKTGKLQIDNYRVMLGMA